ncbi:MAG TPA: tetratricopeptide repeat protein [Caulobacteraceae bacterium]|nr:tetratricopeptide repeat protein [Caulobacteraceae bacterium]
MPTTGSYALLVAAFLRAAAVPALASDETPSAVASSQAASVEQRVRGTVRSAWHLKDTDRSAAVAALHAAVAAAEREGGAGAPEAAAYLVLLAELRHGTDEGKAAAARAATVARSRLEEATPLVVVAGQALVTADGVKDRVAVMNVLRAGYQLLTETGDVPRFVDHAALLGDFMLEWARDWRADRLFGGAKAMPAEQTERIRKGLLTDAETYARAALEVSIETRGAADAAVGAHRLRLARVLLALDRPREAEAELRLLVDLRKTGGDVAGQLAALDWLAEAVRADGRQDEVVELRRQALALAAAHGGPVGEGALKARTGLAYALEAAERLDEAEQALAAVVAATKDARRHDALANLAEFYGRDGRPEQAEPIWREALRLAPANVRESTLLQLVDTLVDLGRYDEAEALLRPEMRREKVWSGTFAIQAVQLTEAWGDLLYRQGRYAEAEAALAWGLDQVKLLPAEYVGNMRTARAGALLRLGREDDALELLKADLAAMERAGARRDAATARLNLASVHQKAGRLAEAEALTATALADRIAMLGPDHPDTVSALSARAGVLAKLGRDAEAEALYRQMRQTLDRRVRAADDTAALHTNYGLFLLERERPGEALPLLRGASADVRRALNRRQRDLETSGHRRAAFSNHVRVAWAAAHSPKP